MKRNIITAIAIIFSILFCASVTATAQKSEQLYPLAGVVTELDRESDIVTVTTYGADYQFYGCEDWFVGDVVAMIMSDNGTKKITDDVIIDYRYCVIPQ